MLLGRKPDLRVLHDLLAAARDGRGGALVLRGDAGIGKSSLIQEAVEAAGDFRVLRVTAVEFEAELPFAGLHQLCAPLQDRVEALPGPQRDALEIAFGRAVGPAPDPFLVGLALLTLLSEAAAATPVLCTADDAQWLDRASVRALAFAARRVGSERIAVLVGLRESHPPGELGALPAHTVPPLPEPAARALLESTLGTPLDNQVRDRVLAEARGNPLVLVQLAGATDPVGLAGGFGVSTARVEEHCARGLADLPDDTRRLLLLAAAEPLGDPLLLWRAANRLELARTAAAPAEEAGLLDVDQRIRFRHPLVRSAVYRSATPHERRAAHAALASATDSERDPDRRAWHRAMAASGPDEEVAVDLLRSAERARGRGGLAAAAVFLERAAALSPDPVRRVDRLLDAAEAMVGAGVADEAGALLTRAEEDLGSPLRRARANLLHGRLAVLRGRWFDAPPTLRRAARHLEAFDVGAARATHLDALLAALVVGPPGEDVQAAARAVGDAPQATDPPGTADLVVDGVAEVLLGRRQSATPLLRRALADTGSEVWTSRPMLAALVAVELWDVEAYERILGFAVERARAAGALTALPYALEALAGASVTTGRFGTADLLHEEAQELADVACVAAASYCGLYLAALRGPRDAATALVDEVSRDAAGRGEGLLVAYSLFATAVLHNGLADYPRALSVARLALERLPFGFAGMVLRELVEAAVRAGEPAEAAEAFERLSARTGPSGTDWATGTEATCAALLATGDAADKLYRTALDHLERAGCHLDLARARLLYGEWLRREGRRGEAREHLRRALDAFATMGAERFADRAARELRATGERARRRSVAVEPHRALTPQELHVARLAKLGSTSREIAAELFLSPRTVEAHLRSVFRKLDISARRELWDMPLDSPAAR